MFSIDIVKFIRFQRQFSVLSHLKENKDIFNNLKQRDFEHKKLFLESQNDTSTSNSNNDTLSLPNNVETLRQCKASFF